MAQTRGNYEQIETAANEMMSLLVSTQVDCGQEHSRAWLMKVAHVNVIAAFDFAQNLATAKSVPDMIEYSRERGLSLRKVPGRPADGLARAPNARVTCGDG